MSTAPVSPRPGEGPYTPRTPRVVAAARLHRRRYRDAAGLFLAEGPQAVREAAGRPGTVVELFGTPDALRRHEDLAAGAERVSPVTDAGLAALGATVHPQGLVAVCRYLHVDLANALDPRPALAVLLAGIADPGNAGTVLRTADAAGAGVVVFPDDTVDPYNGKAVRASAGSLFHLPIVRGGDAVVAANRLRAAGLRVYAADAHGDTDIDTLAEAGALRRPTAWMFGSEAHGLPAALPATADARVRVPIYGRAESLNLAAAAAVCLYASARALRS